MLYTLGHNLALFEKEGYLVARYNLVRKVCTAQVFFLTLLTIWKEGSISHNYNVDL